MTNEEAIKVLYTAKWADGQNADDIIEAISTVSTALERDRWISAEKPPTKSGVYQVYMQAPLNSEDDRKDWCYVTEMYFDKGQTVWNGNNDSYNAILNAVDKESEYFVSHYKSLPEPPKEDKP